MRKGLIFIISLFLVSFFSGCGIDNSKLVGEIVMSHNINVYSQESDNGIVMYSPDKNEFKTLINGVYFDLNGMVFNEDKSKILGMKSSDENLGKNPFIFEYDLGKNTIERVIEESKKLKSDSGISCLKYVPQTKNISFIADNKIYIFDRVKKTNNVLLENIYDKYDWDKTGNKILYGDSNDKIYIYDLTSKKSTQILEGRYPVYSNNNKYIAYQGKDYKLTVSDIDTKKEWKSESLSGNQEYIFSPDDKYIALSTQYSDISNNPHFEMYVVDYKMGKKTKLFKGDGGIPAFDWK
jgi:hypothetical protein